MKKFIKENFTTIVLIIILLMFVKSCGDSQRLTRIEKEYKSEHVINSEQHKSFNVKLDSSFNKFTIEYMDNFLKLQNAVMGKKSDTYVVIKDSEKK